MLIAHLAQLEINLK